MKSEKLKIIFIGTSEFGVKILEGLLKAKYKPILAITAPDKPFGRERTITPPPVKVLAEKYKLLILQPEKILNSESEIKNLNPDLIIVADYGQLLPKEILEIPKYGCLNIHPSLLPKYRGSSPIQNAILNGEKRTGATIISMDEKMDHGPIIAQRKLEIEPEETGENLYGRLADLGANLLMEIIPKWTRAMVVPRAQDDSQATFTKILTREQGKINWKKTAQALEREVRAYFSWPGSYTFWEKRGKSIKIKVLKARFFKSPSGITYPVGKTLVAPQNSICVQCGKGFLGGSGDFLVIEKLQLEGKKAMDSEEFLRGHSDFIGTILK